MENKLLKAKETIEDLRNDIRRINEIHVQERNRWIEQEKFYIEELNKKGSSNELIKYFYGEWKKDREKLEAKIQALQKEVYNLNVNILYNRWE